MKERMSKCLLIVVLLLCMQLSVEMTVYAEEPGADISDAEQQGWWKKDKEKPDFPDLKGGPEKPERVRQQPVDMAILQQQFPGTFILQGPTDQNRIALTFDDGPDPRFTEDVLDVLDQYNVPATFFLLGSRAAAYPEIVERINNEGHIIGNHTYFHPNLVKEGDIPTLEREVTRTEGTLNDIINFRTALFRPPYGFLYSELVEKLAEMQYVIIGWSVDSLDWVEDPPEIIASTVLDTVQPGAIILLHDGADWDGDRTNTVEALKQIIPALQEQGYEFVTVPDLLNIPFAK